MKIKAILFGLGFLVSVPASAQTAGGFSAGLTGGTLGIGPEVGYRISPMLGLRANATFFGLGREVESDGIEYDGDLRLRSFGAMLDVHPFGGGFRVSGGARINRNRVQLEATPAAGTTIEIGDTVYSAAEVGILSGDVEARKFAPTLTLGWGGGITPGLKAGIDAGAMFQGRPRVNNLDISGPIRGRTDVQAALRAEELEIEEDIDNFKVYPIIQLSIGYRF